MPTNPSGVTFCEIFAVANEQLDIFWLQCVKTPQAARKTPGRNINSAVSLAIDNNGGDDLL